MAKMFYTVDETKAALGKNDEELKQLTREGRLREFRDGAKLMYKADQVEALRAEMSGNAAIDQVDLGPSDSGIPIGLVDSKGASGSVVSLVDTDANRAPLPKDDTGLAADLNIGGSIGGVPSPGRVGSMLGGTGTGTSHGSRVGINVFGTDEMPAIDPSAQTAVSTGPMDQVNLDGVGSGSGLLDLTRESDDTSLGADLLDEISPGTKRGAAAPQAGETAAGDAIEDIPAASGGVTRAPVYVAESIDPLGPTFAGAAVGALVFVLVGAFALMSALAGTQPDLVRTLAEYGLWILIGIGFGVTLLFAVVGLVIGKVAR